MNRRNAIKFLESMKSRAGIRLYSEDDDALEMDQFYVSIPVTAMPELKIDGSNILVGPFDSPDSAEDAAGEGATVVCGDGTPCDSSYDAAGDVAVMTAGGPSGMAPPMETTRKGNIMNTRMTEAQLRAQVLKDIKEAELLVPTDAGNSDGSDTSGAGNTNQAGVSSGTNATPADGTPTNQATSAGADRRPSDKDSTEGSPGSGAITSTDGGLDSNGGSVSAASGTAQDTELDSNGGGVKEAMYGRGSNSMAMYSIGNLVQVNERSSNKKVDFGMVTKVGRNMVQIEGSQDYDLSKYNVIKLA